MFGFKWLHASSILLGLLASIIACNSKKIAQNYISDCVLPDDQSSTLSGRWPLTPIKVAYQQGAFSDSEMGAMSLGLQNWNNFYNTSRHFPLFDDGVPNYYTAPGGFPDSPCSSSLIQNNQYSSPVVIYRETNWPYTAAAIAVTTTCPVNSGGNLPSFFMGAMQINYKYFFSSGQQIPDLQSIVLHELGHLVGLKHSCESQSTTRGMPDCDSGSLNPDYRSAVMYPRFSFNGTAGEIRRALNSNDEGRANCIYDTK